MEPISAVQTQPSTMAQSMSSTAQIWCRKDRQSQKCFVNTGTTSNFNNKDKPMADDNKPYKLNYFPPGPNQDNDKEASAEITQQLQRDFKDVFTGIGCFDGTFSLQVKPESKPLPGTPKTCSLCPTKAIQRGVTVTPTARHHNTARCRWDRRMVQ